MWCKVLPLWIYVGQSVKSLGICGAKCCPCDTGCEKEKTMQEKLNCTTNRSQAIRHTMTDTFRQQQNVT